MHLRSLVLDYGHFVQRSFVPTVRKAVSQLVRMNKRVHSHKLLLWTTMSCRWSKQTSEQNETFQANKMQLICLNKHKNIFISSWSAGVKWCTGEFGWAKSGNWLAPPSKNRGVTVSLWSFYHCTDWPPANSHHIILSSSFFRVTRMNDA